MTTHDSGDILGAHETIVSEHTSFICKGELVSKLQPGPPFKACVALRFTAGQCSFLLPILLILYKTSIPSTGQWECLAMGAWLVITLNEALESTMSTDYLMKNIIAH